MIMNFYYLQIEIHLYNLTDLYINTLFLKII